MPVWVSILRWTARVGALLVVGAYATLMIGEMAGPQLSGGPTVLEWAGIALLTMAVVTLIFGWWWEWQAGLLSLAALAIHAALIHGSRTYHRVLLVIATPAILFCLDWAARSRFRRAMRQQ